MSASSKRFPIHPDDRKQFGSSVEWSLVEPHREQALKNHSQTLERLAERGGLSISELYAVVHDRAWKPGTRELAEEWFRSLATESEAGQMSDSLKLAQDHRNALIECGNLRSQLAAAQEKINRMARAMQWLEAFGKIDGNSLCIGRWHATGQVYVSPNGRAYKADTLFEAVEAAMQEIEVKNA